MPNVYNYNFVLPFAAQSNETFINKRVLKIKACSNTLPGADFSSLWNYNLCSQDDAYCQPYVKGDIIYNQFLIDNLDFKQALAVLFDAESDEPIYAGAVSTQTGQDSNLTNYFNVFVNTALLENNKCFYIRLFFYNCIIDETLLSVCIDQKKLLGKNYEEAYFECLNQLCSNITEAITEPYCEVACEGTILIEGVYPKHDCNGNYYAPFIGGSNGYKLQVRVRGEITQQSFSFSKTVINKTEKSSSQTETYLLRTERIPPYVVKQIAACFNAQNIFVEGIQYTNAKEISKNADEGFMWIVSSTLTRECNELDFTCK